MENERTAGTKRERIPTEKAMIITWARRRHAKGRLIYYYQMWHNSTLAVCRLASEWRMKASRTIQWEGESDMRY